MAVEIREEKLELKTYVRGPEDPNPPFQRRGYWSIYPYSLIDDLGEGSRPVQYRALVVENEYLHVTVLPELGGHLYSAVDKATGQDLFYHNQVVKPGLIALRGAWISGGVEFNFPRGHTVTTVSPVDGRLVREDDGSATIWVGDVEQVYRMGWSVGIRLRPGSSLLETEVRLVNRTSLPHPYYFWANAAVPASDDMQLVYPATKVRTWQGPADWPIHEGRDLSRYTSFRFGSDSFMLDSLEDFFGVYYEARDFGVVHVANVHECFGKKYFTWGTAEGGRIWASTLSDSDGPYCEIQSGRYVDQGTWRLLPPHHAERWTEYWYAVKGTGGFSWANREAAVRVWRRDGAAECGVMVTRPLAGATVRVSAGGQAVHEVRADLSPNDPLRVRVPAGRGRPEGPLTLTLLDAGGREVIVHHENQAPRTLDLREAADPAPEGEEKTPGALLREAVRAEQGAEFERARALYEEVLARDPACVDAAVAAGRLLIESSPQDAVTHLRRAAEVAPESPEAAYYLGVALRRAGCIAEAEVELWRASQRPEFAHAARVELALCAMARADWHEAARLLAKGLDYAPEDTKARCCLSAALRRAGRAKEATAEAAAARAEAPADRFAAAEAHFCAAAASRPRIAASRLRELRDMIPASPDAWLELAFDYADAGLYDDAISLLEWAAKQVAAVRQSPLVHYALAYWLDLGGRTEEAADRRRKATRLPPDLMFPHHWELEAILRGALEHDREDGRARSFLGALLYSQGRREDGLAEWEAAAEALAEDAVLHRNVGFGYREVKADADRAAAALRRAVERRPSNPRPYLELDAVLAESKKDPRERLAVLDMIPPETQRRGLVAAQQIAVCLLLGEWDRAISLLTTRTFHRWEMEFRMRHLYVEAYLGRGSERLHRGDLSAAREDFEAALEYPPNLRIGKPAETEDARPQWCAGVACEALGDAAAAKEHWEAAAAESYHRHAHRRALDLHIYRALSLQKLGRSEEAGALLQEELRAAQERVESEPGNAGAHAALGLALKALGRPSDAEGAFRRALELDPWQPRVARLVAADIIL